MTNLNPGFLAFCATGVAMGDLALDICPNNHDCEACRIDHEFLEEMRGVVARVLERPLTSMAKQSSAL